MTVTVSDRRHTRGDGRLDNGLAVFAGALATLGVGVDIAAPLEHAVVADDVAIVFGWNGWPYEATFGVYLATNDIDGDGEPDQSFDDRRAGEGVFQVDPDSFDEFGSYVQFNVAHVVDGVLQAGPSHFRLSIPIAIGDFEFNLDLTVEQARIEGGVVDHVNGVASVDESFDIDGEEVEFGGLKLGGVVPFDTVLALLDELVRDCECAGFDASRPVLTYGDFGTQYIAACEQSPGTGCTVDDGPICENIEPICSLLPSLPSLGVTDVDSDGNGVGDSMSIGLRVAITGATLADPPVAE